jgi:protein-S-isoprenylcysteine O-methyltransferase Ste14
VNKTLEQQTTKYISFAANVALLWSSVLFYRTNHYYVRFLSSTTQQVLFWIALGYTGMGAVVCVVRKGSGPSHALVTMQAAVRYFRVAWQYLRRFPEVPSAPRLSSEERISVLFVLLKFFYLPMMIEFIIANGESVQTLWWSYSGVMSMRRVDAFNEFVFPCLIDVFFIAECMLYAFGYAFESPRLRNQIKSIEPTVLGWVVALACYPPFNGFVNNYAAWYTTDEPVFANAVFTAIGRVAVLLLFGVYFWGAVSLGTKCSNLTNRGIVKTGAFSVIRHPAYAAKNLAWWIGLIPGISLAGVLSMAFWTFLYFLRAITEERHLSADPDYRDYCRKVRWRFVPGLL